MGRKNRHSRPEAGQDERCAYRPTWGILPTGAGDRANDLQFDIDPMQGIHAAGRNADMHGRRYERAGASTNQSIKWGRIMGVGGISIWQLLIVLVIVLLLFGTKKLRNLGGDLGGAIKGFKKAVNEQNNSAQASPDDPDAIEKSPADSPQSTEEPAEKAGGEQKTD